MSDSEPPSREADFGSYLAVVQERDIDLLLMEEFHASDPFVAWFCGQLGLVGTQFDGAWHSVSDADGETDLLLCVRVEDGRVGILVENKIAAPEQEAQDERYHIRGARSQQEGKFRSFVTCICAPQEYLQGVRSDSVYQYRVSYETIQDWFARGEGPRYAWRRRVIQEAITQSRRGYKMIVNRATSDFFTAYWDYVRRRHPLIEMKKPTEKGSKSNWLIMKAATFPRGVQLTHKLDQCVVELGFRGRNITDLLRIKADWPSDIVPVQKGGTAALAIDVPAIDIKKGVTAQVALLDSAFAAIQRLTPYARLFVDHPTRDLAR